jgi:hypothetical protein
MTLDYTLGGALSRDCPWYVERREDQLVFDQLVQGNTCYVLTSHQMGKSSLVVRLVDRLRQVGLRSVAIDLAAFGRELTPTQWYHALAQRVGQQLQLEDAFDACWASHRTLAPAERFLQALEQIAFTAVHDRLIIFIDEIDLLGSLPFSSDRFLQTVHGAAASAHRLEPNERRVGFCLLGTVAPADLWQKPEHIACDLGQVVLLCDFARDNLRPLTGALARQLLQTPEICWLDQLYTPNFIIDKILDRVFYWTNGHPYLTQVLGCAATGLVVRHLSNGVDVLAVQCYDLVDCCCEQLFTSSEASRQDAHLLWIRHRLLHSDLNASQILDSQQLNIGLHRRLSEDDHAQRWRTSGIVRLRQGNIEWRNRIYERVFGGRSFRNDGDLNVPSRRSLAATTPELRQAHNSPLSFLGPTLQNALYS